jgi:myb-related protein
VDKNELLPYYKKLRNEHPINYESLAYTAKNLKTISEDLRKTAISYFRKNDNDSSDDSDSSNENKNLVDQMREKISQIDYQQGINDRSALKKRWWTNEEDEKLKQLVEEYGARNWKRIAGFF